MRAVLAKAKQRLRGLRYRAQAARPRPGALTGHAVTWGETDYAELSEIEVLRPQAGEVTARVHASAVSPGTERAQYLKLPNTWRDRTPGYSAAGTVLAVGSRVDSVKPGDRVAAYGIPHASIANAESANTYPVPDGVELQDAALVHLGVIAAQGVEKAALAPGEAFAVVGAGVVGALAQRLAVASGAGPATVIASSDSKEAIARRGGAEFLVVGRDDDRLEQLALPVVIEASGSPAGVNVAIAAAGEGARIVLLGSPRGATTDLPLDEIRERRLRLIGAHVNTLDLEAARGGSHARRRLSVRFLQALASGLDVGDLVGEPVDPREPEAFYRRLAADRNVVGAYFDWSRLHDEERVARAPLLRLRRRRQPTTAPIEFPDPFAGAEGQLRLGICGCGEIAVANATAAVDAPNVSLTACYDPQPRLAEDLAQRFGGVACPSLDAMLDRADLDAVLVCVPHHLHAPLAIEAVQAGKHVVVEKPPANDLAGAAAMVSAASEAGVTLSVCFPHRYEPKALIARRLISAGALGELQGATIKLFLDKSLAYWVGGYSGRSQSDWRRSRERSGGGVLIMNVSHHIDLLRHLSGLEVDEVAAFMRAGADAGEVEEIASVTLRLANGAVGSVLGGSAVRGHYSTEFRLWGREGHVALEPAPEVFTLRAIDGIRTGGWRGFGDVPAYDMRAAYLSRLATAITRGEEPDVGAGDALAVQAIMEAAYRASESGSLVRPADLLAEVPA